MEKSSAPYTWQGLKSIRVRTLVQPMVDLSVRWSQMRSLRRKAEPRNGNGLHRHRMRGEPPFHSANLGSPIFVESWNGGSPLNWVEFMGRWEMTRIDGHSPTEED
jgi:hypothetical protein